MAVAQTVERLVEPRGCEDFRAADQMASREIFQHEEIVLRAMTLDVFLERSAGGENLLAQAFGVVRQGRDPHQTVARQLLQLGQVG